MGNTKSVKVIQFGQITSTRTASGVDLSLPYKAEEDIRMSVIIQNKIGRAVFESNFDISSEQTSLDFEIPDVTGGEYDAWIDVKGEVFIRRITILPQPKKGLFGWFKSKLPVFIG
jgi:hypothetical protein